MSDFSPSILQLTEGLANLLGRLEAYGYDEVLYPQIRIVAGEETRVFANIYLDDNFQSSISWGEKIQQGTHEFDWNPTTSRFTIPLWFKSREQRELEVAIAKTGRELEFAQQLRGAFAAEYVRRLTEDLDRFKLLSAPKG